MKTVLRCLILLCLSSHQAWGHPSSAANIQVFQNGYIRTDNYFGEPAVLLYSKPLLQGISRIYDFVLIRPTQLPPDLKRALSANQPLPVRATVKGQIGEWAELLNIELRRDCEDDLKRFDPVP